MHLSINKKPEYLDSSGIQITSAMLDGTKVYICDICYRPYLKFEEPSELSNFKNMSIYPLRTLQYFITLLSVEQFDKIVGLRVSGKKISSK